MPVSKAKPRVTGAKQVLRAIERGKVERVFVASDADPFLRGRVIAACAEHGVPCQTTHSMLNLGKACGIAVGATACGVLKPD